MTTTPDTEPRRSPTGKLKRSLRHLERETKRLKNEQGRLARKNARRNVLEALRSVRSALNEEYPVSRKERGPTKRRSRRMDSVLANFSEIQSNTIRFGQLHKVGIKLKHVHPSHKAKDDTQTRNHGRWYGPTWAVFAPPDTTIEQFKKARKSPTERNALATLGRLWREQSRDKACAQPGK